MLVSVGSTPFWKYEHFSKISALKNMPFWKIWSFKNIKTFSEFIKQVQVRNANKYFSFKLFPILNISPIYLLESDRLLSVRTEESRLLIRPQAFHNCNRKATAWSKEEQPVWGAPLITGKLKQNPCGYGGIKSTLSDSPSIFTRVRKGWTELERNWDK